MEDKLKKFLLNKYNAKRIRNSDFSILYKRLLVAYSPDEIEKVIKKYDKEITLFEPNMKSWKVKNKFNWYINQLICRESDFRLINREKNEKKIFDPNKYRPLVKGIQVVHRSTFWEKI